MNRRKARHPAHWLWLPLLSLTWPVLATPLPSCYDTQQAKPAQNTPGKVLYVFVDQTTPLTAAMKNQVLDLTRDWGGAGEALVILRFSANVRGQYSELMFDETVDTTPSDDYLFNLRSKDNKAVRACLKERRDQVRTSFQKVLSSTLELTNKKLPKTNLLHSLQEFSRKRMRNDPAPDKTILLVSDGLENSQVFSFHTKTSIKLIKPEAYLATVRKKELIAEWRGAKVFILGLGYLANDKTWVQPSVLEPLSRFWVLYFQEGGGSVIETGTPMLLRTSLRQEATVR